MDSKYGQSNNSSTKRAYELPIDSCNHFISTSLRDLSVKYKELSFDKADCIDANEKDLTAVDQGEK